MKLRNTLTRSAAHAPKTYNAEARTVEVVWGEGAPMQRRDATGPFHEVLDMAGADLSRMTGAPVFLDHVQSTRAQIGVVEKVWIENGRGLARIKLSSREEFAGYVRDIAEGIIRNVSVGYQVTRWLNGTDNQGRRMRTAATWIPFEISFVGVAADPAAKVRSRKMDPELENAPEQPAQVQPPVNEMATRNAAIRTLCRQNSMSQQFTDSLIDGEGDVIAARAAVNAELVRQSQATPALQTRVGPSAEDPAVIRERRIEARYVRDNGGQLSEAARPYAYESLQDWARDSLRRANVSTLGLSPDEIFVRASTHGTSDFPELLTGVGRRTLLAAYQTAPTPIKTVARSTTMADFRNKSALRKSGIGLLEEIGEHGEIPSGTVSESKESYGLKTRARMFGISRKALQNDDLGAFNDAARMFGQAAAQTEAAVLVELLESNPNLDDNTAVFDSSRNNFLAGGWPISVASIDVGRLAMRKLTDDDGTLISVGPKYMLVPAELETVAQQFVAAYQPANFADTNPFSNLVVLVEPRLTPHAWYLFGDPALAPVLEYAHLAGANGPVIESRPAWTTLGLETRAYLDFGAGFVGWKGAHKFESGEDSNSQV